MYEVPTDTMYADRPIADRVAPPRQPNTPAPIALYQSGYHRWVSPRVIFGVTAGMFLLVVGAIAMRSTAIANEGQIRIESLKQPVASKQVIDDFILEGSTENLGKLVAAANIKVGNDQLALHNQRAKEITDWANKLVGDKNSSCFKSVYGRKCYLEVFMVEQLQRYRDAYRSRKWKEANDAMFQVQSARIAWEGSADLLVEGDATATAIENELKAKVENQRLTANSMAAEMRGDP